MKLVALLFFSLRAFAIYGGLPLPEGFPIPAPVVQIETDFDCSAVILNDTTLLTAGHCTESLRTLHYQIRVTNPNTKKSYVTKIKKAVRHPDYKLGFKNHPTIPTTYADLAVLKLAKPIPFAHTVASLPREEFPQTLTSTVWLVANGSTRTHLTSSNLSLPTTAYKNNYKSWSIKAIPKKSGPCIGDSGGGYFEINGREVILFAIQSTRTVDYKCDDERSVSFAVDVHSSLVWISPLL